MAVYLKDDTSNKRPRTIQRRALRGATGGVALLPLFIAASLFLSSPAAAYLMTANTFADGSASANLLFQQGVTELTGPSLRVLANSTVTGGSVVVSGYPGYLNTTAVETSTSDFASYSRADNVSIALGSITAGNDSRVLRFDTSNLFGNASTTYVSFNSEGAYVSSGTIGALTTENLTAPPGGWGNLLASVGGLRSSAVAFNLLYPNGSVLQSGVAVGSTITLDPASYPSLRVQATMLVVGSETPVLRWFQLGAAAGDTLFGSGTSRTSSGVVLNSTVAQATYNWTSITKYAGNPVISRVLNTYYSAVLDGPHIIKVGSEWWMYLATSTAGATWTNITRAVSTDLTNWTMSPQPVLNLTASAWDSVYMHAPYVMVDPAGNGYIMYYTAITTDNHWRIGRATSTDGVTWTKYSGNPVLSPSASGWDSSYISGPFRVIYNNGSWTMWYVGDDHIGQTALQSDLGIAYSSDGINWTKYASNPVMTHGGSPNVDNNDVGAGRMYDSGGTTYFYYSCTTTQQYDICLATSTDGGYTWSKVGRVLQRGSGWDSYDIYYPFLLLDNGTLYMFYGGSDGQKAQIGRAVINPDRGVVRGTIDFGSRVPARFTGLALNSTGSSVEFAIRTSSNGVTYSAWENLTGVLVPNTSPARFVDYIAYLNATGSTQPTFSGFQLGYTGFVNLSRYESSLFTFSDAISGASINVSVGGLAGAYSLDLSIDNGTTWTRVLPNQFITFSSTSYWIYYGITIEAATNGAPLIDAVSLSVERRGFPQDVSVRLGNAGSRILNLSGVMAASYNLTLPASEINSAVAAAVAANPAITSIDLPFIVTSAHFGLVVVGTPVLTYQLKNPLFATFTPSSVSLNIDENTTTAFSANAYSFPPTVPANVSWYLDGVLQSVSGNASLFNYTADFFAAGNHTVRCDVENGDFAVNRTWPIVVRNVNRPPTFVTVTPGSPLSASHTATTQFTASAVDLDLENITVRWFIDGVPAATNVSNLDVSGLLVGLHRINVTASDGTASTLFSWALTITNALPVVATTDPVGNFSMSHTDSKTVSVLFTDADSEPLLLVWNLDGSAAGAGLTSLTVADLPVGFHMLGVTATDAYGSISFQWAITSTNAAPVFLTFDPVGDFSLSHSASLTITVSASDADGDSLGYGWSLDGGVFNYTGPSFTVTSLPVGAHYVVVRAADSYTLVSHRWNITSSNVAPLITVAAGPAPGQTLSHRATVDLAVAITDLDGDSVSVRWYVNGVLAGSNVSNITIGMLGMGATSVRVTAADPYATSEWTWSATGNNTGPSIVAFAPTNRTAVSIIDRANFSVTATDPDGDPLTYRWSVDLVPLVGGAPTATVSTVPLGTHVVFVVVSDGLDDATHDFDLDVVNLGPEVLHATPEGLQVMVHFETRTFAVEAFDHEGDALTYAWAIDNNSLLSHDNSTAVGPLSDGLHLLQVMVRDGASQASYSWFVRVNDRPPTVEGATPAPGAITLGTRETANFSARFVDPDGDPVTARWLEDNRVVNGSAGITRSWDQPGTHTIVFEGTAGGVTKSVVWNVTVAALNKAPTVSSALPSTANVTVEFGQSAGFVVDIADDGVLPMEVTWYLDGAVVGHGTGYVYEPPATASGTHTVRAVADDGEFQAQQEWTVQVQQAAPIQAVGGFDLTALIIGLAVGLAAGLAALMMRSKRGDQGPPPPSS